jgi:hypothetical protein
MSRCKGSLRLNLRAQAMQFAVEIVVEKPSMKILLPHA